MAAKPRWSRRISRHHRQARSHCSRTSPAASCPRSKASSPPSSSRRPRSTLSSTAPTRATRSSRAGASRAGKAVAVTTDASGRWSSPWVQDGIFGQFWSKVLAWMTPQTAATEQKFDVALGYREGRIHLRLTDYSDRPAPSAATGQRDRHAPRRHAACEPRFPKKFRASFTAASTRHAPERTTSRSRRPRPAGARLPAARLHGQPRDQRRAAAPGAQLYAARTSRRGHRRAPQSLARRRRPDAPRT